MGRTMFPNLSVNIGYPDVSRQEIMKMRGEIASVWHALNGHVKLATSGNSLCRCPYMLFCKAPPSHAHFLKSNHLNCPRLLTLS